MMLPDADVNYYLLICFSGTEAAGTMFNVVYPRIVIGTEIE